MQLNLAPNPLHNQAQILQINKVATLIGENGCGKSSILQSVFEQRLNKLDYNDLNVVAFSSGQNENFSERFGAFLSKERRAGRELNLECLYFDKSWSKLLIFLATAIKRNGKVRSFLIEKDYVSESDQKDDESTRLQCAFRVDKNYVDRVKDALKKQEGGDTDTLRDTPYFRTLESFINNLISADFEFEETLKKRTVEIPANRLIDVSFDQPTSIHFSDNLVIPSGEKNSETRNHKPSFAPEVSFFTQAADNDYFIDKSACKLTFNKDLELDQLSDGEYQLLFLYALIDLFDGQNTLFLLDEADSHLHYKNVEKLWELLHNIKGHAITTTHLLDSISAKENRIEHLKVVENGRINEDNKIKQLIKRLSVLSRAKSVEFDVVGKIPHLAIMDDYNDWMIFTKLAAKKGHDISRLASIHAFKQTSSYTTDSDTLGSVKVEWVKGLSKSETETNTTKIFLICDKDEAHPRWNPNNHVQLAGETYSNLINSIQWPNQSNVKTFLLAWKRREIKNYLLSFSALSHHGVLSLVNNANIAAADYLQANEPGDNDSIRRMQAKDAVDPLINTDGIGLDPEKLQAYIDLIPADEISEDITNMYNFIIGKL